MTRRINAAGLAMLRELEGLRLKPYYDAAGFPTIGHGHLLAPIKGAPLDRWQPISEDEAGRLLSRDLTRAEHAVTSFVEEELTDNQFSALVSFVFNIGANAFRNSTMRVLLNDGTPELAAHQFSRWIFAGGEVLEGLVKRREREKDLFLRADVTA